jgi:ABC-type glycerol-3-phosphate transport system substrate-binding protein
MALGTGKKVDHSFEILSALILQRGDAIVKADGRGVELGRGAEEPLAFYASFAEAGGKNFSWTSRLPKSLDAFAAGQAVMSIGFSADRDRIRAKNPHLNFGIAPLPQSGGSRPSRTFASYFFPTVSRLSKNSSPAWQFVFWVSGAEGAKAYQQASGRPPARRDLISAGGRTEAEQVFFKQALIARSWPIPDEGASRRMFEEAIDSVVSRAATPAQAINKIRSQLQLLLP